MAPTGGTGTTFGSTVSLAGPRFLAVDGSGNVWASNFNANSVSELSSSGTILSPQTTGTVPAVALGYVHEGIASPTGITIDPSGNVWIANDVAATATTGASVFELVGAAAPAVTPIALALKNGTVGAKP
jgi:streptogramin lyase